MATSVSELLYPCYFTYLLEREQNQLPAMINKCYYMLLSNNLLFKTYFYIYVMSVTQLPVLPHLTSHDCCDCVLVLGSDNVVLPDKLVDAMAYQPEAVRTSLSDLYKVLHAEAEQVYKMRETGI